MTSFDPLRGSFISQVALRSLEDCGPEKLIPLNIDEALRSGRLSPKSDEGKLWVFGVGKASLSMAFGTLETLRQAGIVFSPGVIIAPEDQRVPEVKKFLEPLRAAGFQVEWGAHPHPTQASLEATDMLLGVAAQVSADDVVVFLLSGGASALLCKPIEGVSVERQSSEIRELMKAGTPIDQINRTRMSMSQVKSGNLRKYFKGAVEAFVLVDVPNGDAELVGSGPFAGTGVTHTTIGSAMTWLARAAHLARAQMGMGLIVDTVPVTGEVMDLAKAWAEDVRKIQPTLKQSRMWLRIGEPVVRVPENARFDRGGRCQHLALAMARELAGVPGWRFLALTSDGRDAETTAAGAFAGGATWEAVERMGLGRALDAYESHYALSGVRQTVVTGKTFNNINDLFILAVNPVDEQAKDLS